MIRRLPLAIVLILMLVFGGWAVADSWIGDAGHFFVHRPTIHMNNPQGKAFSVTMHRHVLPMKWGNAGDYQVAITDPAGKEIAKGTIPSGKASTKIDVPAGGKGVYQLHVTGAGSMAWVECTLGQMVVACGPYDPEKGPGRYQKWLSTFILYVMVPRRWYFFVPEGTETFKVKHTIMPFQSHREDYGFLVMSPKGQRFKAFYGGKPFAVERELPNDGVLVKQTIEVDPGTAGRFWSIWATGGDSHNFSDLQIMLNGVPPYFAPTPEQWFDPRTGKAAPSVVRDASPIRLLDEHCKVDPETGERLSRTSYRWSQTPHLGDDNYTGMLGPHTVYLRNPENRRIDFGVGSYIIPDATRLPVRYRVFGPDGKQLVQREGTYAHEDDDRVRIEPAGAGVYRVDVEASKWFAWTEPAVPMVLAGKPAEGGGARFRLQIGLARHWFFRVPHGIRAFDVGIAVEDPAHALHAEIHAPDRMMDILYARGGRPEQATIDVPRGLDGKIWFIRTEVGSRTRFVSDNINNPKHVRIDTDIRLTGVPPYLAPTWEQWFDPVQEGKTP